MGQDLYRGAASSLPARVRGKLVGRETWYKEKKRRIPDEFDKDRRQERGGKRKKGEQELQREARTVGVLFVPYTAGGELAKRYREAETELGKQTGIKLKIVEKSGTKLVDLLHRSDPWQGKDCERPLCLLCTTKQATGKRMRQDCTQRCIIYETWCLSCEERDRKEVEDMDIEEDEKRKKMKEVVLHKYVGETSRSMYERGLEHLRDLKELKKGESYAKALLGIPCRRRS